MDIRIFYILTVLVVISSTSPFVQGSSLISVQTDKDEYEYGDTILISGNVSTLIGDTQVTLQLFQGSCESSVECNLVDIAQIKVAQDGNYFETMIAQGPLWKVSGEYSIKAVYGEQNISETVFTFTPEIEVVTTVNNFEVSAGDSGTFDIKYHIKGGIIKDIVIDPQILGLVVDIEAQNRGTLTLDLPRQYIDAEKQDGKDDVFIILIDNMETNYNEPTLYSEIRTITIDFEKDDSKIQIIGTHVIPEFGTIVMIVLTIGIMASIVFTRNRFQIKI